VQLTPEVQRSGRKADHSTQSMPKLRMSGALPPIPIGLHNVHRKNLTFNFILSLVQHLKNLTKH